MHDVVLAGGRTPVHVRGSGFGRLRAGDVTTWVFGTFDRTLMVRVAQRIEVKLGGARVVLTPSNIFPGIAAPAPVRVVDIPVPRPAILIPRPRFHVVVRLYEYVSARIERDRGET